MARIYACLPAGRNTTNEKLENFLDYIRGIRFIRNIRVPIFFIF